MNSIHPTFQHGNNFQIGSYCIIEEDVVVGDNVKLGNYVMLKRGTHFGNSVDFADNCVTTGVCLLGNHVAVRTGAIISKANIIEDWCFIGPGVITNHTKKVIHGRVNLKDEQLLTYIGYGSIIGSQVSILAGVFIAPLVVVGGGSTIVKDLLEQGVYFGAPCSKRTPLPDDYLMELPINAGKMYLSSRYLEYFQQYLPQLNLSKYKSIFS